MYGMPDTNSRITDVKLLFSVTLLAGEILLSSGAEIYRVEDTISRLLALSGYAGGESFVTPSCILLTLRTPDSEAMTTLRRVPSVVKTTCPGWRNQYRRPAWTEGKISLEDAQYTSCIHSRKERFSGWVKSLILIFLPICFFLFFGGQSRLQGAICLLTGLWLAVSGKWLIRQSVVPFFS
jgi:uncharacterized membrane protein YjjP (DUF1212 family)